MWVWATCSQVMAARASTTGAARAGSTVRRDPLGREALVAVSAQDLPRKRRRVSSAILAELAVLDREPDRMYIPTGPTKRSKSGATMPRRRFHELPPERRDQLLVSAARAFAEHGYDGASLNQILATAGVSKGAAYYYFDDKADLFATVARHAVDQVLAPVDLDFATLDAATFWPKIRELYVTLAARTREQPWLLGITKAMWTLSKDARGNAILAPLWDWARGWLRELVARGQAVGVVRRDLPTELLIEVLLAIDGAFDQYTLAHLDEPGDDVSYRHLDALLDMARRGLAPPGGEP